MGEKCKLQPHGAVSSGVQAAGSCSEPALDSSATSHHQQSSGGPVRGFQEFISLFPSRSPAIAQAAEKASARVAHF